MKQDFIDIHEPSLFGGQVLADIYQSAKNLKRRFLRDGNSEPSAQNKILAAVFAKKSLRTRVSFEVAMAQLGGQTIRITGEEIGLGTRESIADIAHNLSDLGCAAIAARTYSHQTLIDLASNATIPVINALSGYSHPCQAMADILTLEEAFGKLEGLTMVFVGDGNNVARSLAAACQYFGVNFVVSSPKGYELKPEPPFNEFKTEPDPYRAVANAQIIYTDTWYSMGQEEEREARLSIFAPYQVNAELIKKAPLDVRVMHCQPAHRGEEITSDIMDGPASLIRQQSANRMHFQKGLLHYLFTR